MFGFSRLFLLRRCSKVHKNSFCIIAATSFALLSVENAQASGFMP
jgi:hypothetical protein